MDPQDQFKKRYEDFIAQRQQVTTGVNNPQSKTRSPFNKFYALGIILGIVIILPALFLFMRQNTYNGSEIASTDSTTELSNELKLMMGNTVSEAQSKPETLKRAQRNIKLKKEAQKLGVSLPQQIAASSTTGPQTYSLDELTLQKALEKKVVTSRTIDFVSTYVIPTGDYKTVEAKVKSNLEFIRQELRSGRSVTVAYANLVKKLGQDPKYNVVQNAYVTPDSGYSSGFITALFKAKNGEVTQVIQSNGTDFMVAKVLGEVNTKYKSLAAWEKETIK